MAIEHKTLEGPPPSSVARFETKYPDLKKWLNGSWWELEAGKDFKTTSETFYQGFKDYAKRNGIAVQVSQRGKNIWVRAGGSPTAARRKKPAARKRKARL